MAAQSEPRRGRLGLLMVVASGIGFVFLAPLGLLTLPLAALILFSQPMQRRFRLTAALAGGMSLWWLAQFGDPPDQVVRAVAVMGTAVFIMTLAYTNWSLVHRSLIAMVAAAIGVTAFATVSRMSWSEIRWWVETRIGFSTQITLSWLSASNEGNGGALGSGDAMVIQFEDWFDVAVPLMADFFPATTAIQMLAGFALASVLVRRMDPARHTLGRFKNFRFTEHLGWAAVVALAIVLMTRLVAIKLLATNVLIVTGVLYAIRGAAVMSFALAVSGGPGLFTTAMILFAIVFMLPVVLAGTILLGVVDTGLDLRQRWSTPRART